MYIGGWICTPLEKNKTQITLLVECNPKGNIPTAMVKMGNKDAALKIATLRTILADY
jgi:hypothetical protein